MKKVSVLLVDSETGEVLVKCVKELPFNDGTNILIDGVVNYAKKYTDCLLRGIKQQKNLAFQISVETCNYSQPYLFCDVC